MSDLKFTCQTCGQPIVVAASEAGRKLACPTCKTQLTIPKAQPASREEAVAGEGGQTMVSDAGLPAGPTRPEHSVSEKATLPPMPSLPATPETPATPATPLVAPAEGKSSLRLEPVEAPTHPVSAQPAAALRRALATEQDRSPEIPLTDESEKSEDPAERVVPVAPSPPAEVSPAADDAPQPVQIAVLSNDLKRSIVGAARELIADPSRWMPGVGDQGKLVYAARKTEEQWKRVEPGIGEATHHSLMGAVLHELHRRNVAPTANGRTEFLDRDIPEAIRRIIPEGPGPGGGGKPIESTDVRLMSISHAQCLEVLDLLGHDYAAKASAEGAGPAHGEGRGASPDELLVRAARDEVVMVTEVLRAVHAELVALSHRVSELEKTAGSSAPTAPTR